MKRFNELRDYYEI